jgi:hypothetical protein
VAESEDYSKLFRIRVVEDTGPAGTADPQDGKLGKSTSGCAHTQSVRSHVDTAEKSAEMAGESHQADGESFH